jgi:hypothetical protein
VLGVEDTSPWVAYARIGGIMTLRRVMHPGPVYYLYDPWPDHEIESESYRDMNKPYLSLGGG